MLRSKPHFILAGCIMTGSLHGANHQTSQTTFIPRSLVNDPVYTTALTNFRFPQEGFPGGLAESNSKNLFHLQPFYTRTTDHKRLARYFLFGGKTELSVKPDASGDIVAIAIGLDSEATTKFGLHPERIAYGSFLTWQQTLDSLTKGLWVSATIVPTYVRHALNPGEDNRTVARDTNEPTKILDFLGGFGEDNNRFGIKYGKFSLFPQSKVGLDDVLTKIGYSVYHKRRGYGAIYGCISFPLGQKQTGEFAFEPQIGTEHWGFGGGIQVDRRARVKNKTIIALIGKAHYLYRLREVETRSLDFKHNGPWSRFLTIVREGAQNDNSNDRNAAINETTRQMYISPRSEGNILLSVLLQRSDLNVHIGYEAWARSSEKAHLKNRWNPDIERFGIANIRSDSSFFTQSKLTVSSNPESVDLDSSFVRIQESDLNLDSATHKGTVSNKLFAAISTRIPSIAQHARVGIAGSYEFAHANTTAETWSIWTNLIIPF